MLYAVTINSVLTATKPTKGSRTLASPVGLFMRATTCLAVEDSVVSGAAELRCASIGAVPITENGVFVGAITQELLGQIIGDDVNLNSSLGSVMRAYPSIEPYASAAEALRLVSSSCTSGLFVVDDRGHVVGVVSPSDLVSTDAKPEPPPMVGGMATPFGVYLTSGSASAGATGFALVATGMSLFGLYLTGNLMTDRIESAFGEAIPEVIRPTVLAVIPFAMLLILMRALPISGTHGAEHQVVHALERGEPLVPEVIRRMPRVHPRCGTNLAVAASIFLGMYSWNYTQDEKLRLLVAVITTAVLWKPIGNFLQQFLTTRTPNAKQLNSGLKAAHELLERHSSYGVATPTIFGRIWHSDALHVMLGSTLCYFLVLLLEMATGWKLGVELFK